MALFWEPVWVRKKVSFKGIEVETCVDETTGILLCPLCHDIDKICPPEKKGGVVSDNMVTFFSVEDLIRHLSSHGDIELEKARVRPLGPERALHKKKRDGEEE